MGKEGTPKSSKHRAVIVGGLRTPFVKSGGSFKGLSALDLGKAVVTEMLHQTQLDPTVVDRLVFGQVVINPATPNIAREIVLGTRLPRSVDAYSVSRACATSTQALIEATQAIQLGDAEVVICGGADSLSRPPIMYQDGFIDVLMEANSAREPLAKAKAFLELKPKDLLPKPPALKEQATGLTMGESCEKMAQQNGIERAAQDEFAARSHQRAARAWQEGIFDSEVMSLPVGPDYNTTVHRDGIVRDDTSVEKLSRLRPVFDKKYGTITAGNSSPLTDGAAALVVMSEARARDLGFEPLAAVRAYATVGIDPSWQLLMGPAFAIPKALARAGLTLDALDLIDMHEAFAAQILSNTRALSSAEFCAKHLKRDAPVGEISFDKLNVHGGSIAIGHPFGATGARQALTMANALRRRGSGTALISQCAAGGLGAAVVLER